MSEAKVAVSNDPTAALPKSARKGVWWPIRVIAWIALSAVLSGIVIAPLDTWSQAMFGATIFVFAFVLSRVSKARYVTLVLILLSVTASLRYLYWRGSTTVANEVSIDLVLGLILFMAEIYAVLVLLLGYAQMAWPLRRRPVALPKDMSTWPTVDIYIPTYNEPLSVVRTTVLAAKNLDWPADKLNVYILDDGRRDQFRQFATEAGVGYIIRPDNKHAKAGNINHALQKTRGDLIAIFDCDHIPTRSFLQLTVGWFMRDAGLAMVQTPHHFYSPDPFEKNLGNFKRVPNEGELFYGVIQNGNDLWNASFFCGSCAIIRRAPLESIGGIAPETVTEDAHTMLKLHRRGWRSAYLDIPQAGGLATENLAGHVGQRIRWARGMAQIFRIDNPFLGRGLNMLQRICYASAMLHFFYGIPRIIFLLAPLPFLLFGAHIFNASAETILAFALPHMAHAYLTSSRIQGAHRHSFWAEVYEATLATYITYPTTLALISPKLGKFNVTAKGGISEVEYFDIRIALPYLVLLLLTVTGIGVGIWKYVQPGAETASIAINLAWAGYALLILTATLAVAWERRQRRIVPRVAAKLPVMLRLPDQKVVACETVDLSITGMALRSPIELPVTKDELVEVTIRAGLREAPADARVVQKQGLVLRLRFEQLPIEAEETVVNAVFGRPTAWTDWKKGRKVDRPLISLFAILALGVRGALMLPRWLLSRKRAAALLFAAGLGAVGTHEARAVGWTLEGLGYGQAQQKYNRRTSIRLPFFARGDRVFTAAELVLEFDQSVKIGGAVKALKVGMNDEPVAEVSIADLPPKLVLQIPPQLLEERNAITFDLVLAEDNTCPGLVDVGTWRFLRGGTLETKAATLPLPNELDMLPLPFFDPSADTLTPIHIVFPRPPDEHTMRIGGLVAAYFGLRAGARFTFPVHFRELPEEHCVLLLTPEDAGMIPDLGPIEGPMVAMRDNPAKAETAKVLVIAGRDLAELERAVKRLTFDFEATKGGDATRVFDGWLPPETDREPYDAPRWFQSGQPLRLGMATPPEKRRFTGGLGGTIAIELRIPPDVFTWPQQYVELDLMWSSSVPPGVERPELKVEINGHFLASLELEEDPDAAKLQSRKLRVPVTELAGFNVLYVHIVPPETSCPSAEHDVVSVEVLPDSTLHLEEFPNFKPMPDLGTFVDDGFPFTRLADLSQTAIALPAKPLPEEVGTVLSFLAHTTAVTGVPPTRPTFLFGDLPAGDVVTTKDLLLVGVGERLRALGPWEPLLPLRGLAKGRVELPAIPWWRKVLAFSQGHPLDDDLQRLAQSVRPGEERAYVLGIESPFAAGRSVVIIAGQTPAVMPSIAQLRGFSEALSPQADVLVQSGPRRASFHIMPSYDVGTISPYKQFLWFVTRHWLLLVPTLFVSVLLFAWLLKKRLANVEYRRLALTESPK
ncbi:MAG: UDP-forming cellulose synthase catalytic subunit [Deltaproteobacteria bacterium]|nr:UDP-forming cellulose synthase catalytic subunit [Deltaproteobacteria bacterium]